MNSSTPPVRRRARQIVRALLGAGLVAAGVWLMFNHSQLRELETVLAGALADAVTPGEMYVAPQSHTFFWASATAAMHGLRITVECTAAFLLGPLLITAGLVLASGRFTTVRTLLAAGSASVILMLANQARLVLIAWATAEWGVADGYQWSHTVGGSVVVGAGVAIALSVFLIILVAHRRSRGVDSLRPRARHAAS